MSDLYAKLWTTMLTDEWFTGLSGNERGLYLQMIVYSKAMGDTGVITGKSWAFFGGLWGYDGKTVRKNLGNFLEEGKVTLKIAKRCITITLLNYDKNQRVRTTQDSKKQEKTTENSSLNKSRVDKNRIDKSKKEKPVRPAKPKDERPPIIKFDEWVKDNTEKIEKTIKRVTQKEVYFKGDFIDRWSRREINKARGWLETADRKKTDKTNWATFLWGWLNRAWEALQEKPNVMTPKQEQDYHDKNHDQSRGQSDGFSKVGSDLLGDLGIKRKGELK